jgi:hypothetical protein
MRYTTIIDISQMGEIYRNQNVRLIYLHLVLRSGYHDDDRDLTDISLRRLSMEAGLTVSATRHAIRILMKAGLLKRQGMTWTVLKWVMTPEITSRQKTGKAARQAAEAEERERQQRAYELKNRRRSVQEQTDDMVKTYEQYLKQQAEGTIGMVGKGYLERFKDEYQALKSK